MVRKARGFWAPRLSDTLYVERACTQVNVSFSGPVQDFFFSFPFLALLNFHFYFISPCTSSVIRVSRKATLGIARALSSTYIYMTSVFSRPQNIICITSY